MTQTPNFQLNQWSGTDYVRRTDFNADNAKIDTALQNLKEDSAAKKLGEWTLDAAAGQLSAPLAGINPGDYTRLRLFFWGTDCEEEYDLRVNGVAAGYDYSYVSGNGDTAKAYVPLASWEHCACWIDLYPTPKGVAMYVRGTVCSNSGRGGRMGVFGYLSTVSYDQLESVQILCKTTKNLGAGSKLTLYGMKY